MRADTQQACRPPSSSWFRAAASSTCAPSQSTPRPRPRLAGRQLARSSCARELGLLPARDARWGSGGRYGPREACGRHVHVRKGSTRATLPIRHSTRDTLLVIRSRTSLGNRLRSSSITFDAPSVGLIERTWSTALSRDGTSLSLSLSSRCFLLRGAGSAASSFVIS